MQLSTSDRVNLIKEISNRLSSENWSIVDLTLKAFGLNVENSWNGDVPSYIVSSIENAPSATLLEIASHLGYSVGTGEHHNIEPPFWKKSRLRMFISHLAAHKLQASNLQQALNDRGISSFVAHEDIEPAKEWQVQIELALATCDILVALLHPEFHSSKWTDQEIGFCMGRGVPVFAVRLGQDPYGFIGRFQAFNGNGKEISKVAEEIFEAVCKNKQTQSVMGNALVSIFEESDAFAVAKERIRYLETLNIWEPNFAERILNAKKANSQISGSWGVPERVDALAAAWKK